jgi:hypothetical protein
LFDLSYKTEVRGVGVSAWYVESGVEVYVVERRRNECGEVEEIIMYLQRAREVTGAASGVLEMCPRAHREPAVRSSESRNKVKLPNRVGMRETPQCGWNECRISRLQYLCKDTPGSHDLFYVRSTCVAIRLRGTGPCVSMMPRGWGHVELPARSHLHYARPLRDRTCAGKVTRT